MERTHPDAKPQPKLCFGVSNKWAPKANYKPPRAVGKPGGSSYGEFFLAIRRRISVFLASAVIKLLAAGPFVSHSPFLSIFTRPDTSYRVCNGVTVSGENSYESPNLESGKVGAFSFETILSGSGNDIAGVLDIGSPPEYSEGRNQNSTALATSVLLQASRVTILLMTFTRWSLLSLWSASRTSRQASFFCSTNASLVPSMIRFRLSYPAA